MKRLSFLAALIGIGTIRAEPQTTSKSLQWRDNPAIGPLNNQCPACGTMADPTHMYVGSHYIPCDPPFSNGNVSCTEMNPVPPHGKRGWNMVICKYCRSVFAQELEP